MTGKEQIKWIQDQFDGGRLSVVIEADDPVRVKNRIGNYIWRHKLGWRMSVTPGALVVKSPAQTAKPENGPRCGVCGKLLKPYDIQRGECFKHPVERQRAAREGRILMTDEAQRRRVMQAARGE